MFARTVPSSVDRISRLFARRQRTASRNGGGGAGGGGGLDTSRERDDYPSEMESGAELRMSSSLYDSRRRPRPVSSSPEGQDSGEQSVLRWCCREIDIFLKVVLNFTCTL